MSRGAHASPSARARNAEANHAGWRTTVESTAHSRPTALLHAMLDLTESLDGGGDPALADALRQALAARSHDGAAPDANEDSRLDRVFPSFPAAPPRPAPETPPTLLDEEQVAAILGPSGAFASKLATYEHRDSQIDMARTITRAFNEGKHLMAEGGTGIGKSLAYLVPAILWATTNRRAVVVSTNTKNLQSQLFRKDIPLVRRAMNVEFKAALIKGRLNYLCLRKLLRALASLESETAPSERPLLAAVLWWSATGGSGDFSECPDWGGANCRGLLPKLTSTSEECLGRACPHARRCFLMRARAASQAADLVVANHSLVFAEMGLQSPALPPYASIVFDEAHNLEDAATKHFSVELSAVRFRFEFGRLWNAGFGRDGAGAIPALVRQLKEGVLPAGKNETKDLIRDAWTLRDLVHAAEDAVPPLFEALRRGLGERDESRRFGAPRDEAAIGAGTSAAQEELRKRIRSATDRADALSRSLRELSAGALPLQAEALHDLDAAAARLRELSADMDFVLQADDPEFVFWVEPADPRQGGARAVAAPIDVGKRLAEGLYSEKDNVIMVSATLSVAGSFDYLKRRIGMGEIESGRVAEIAAGSPFDFASQCVVLVPTFLPDPAADDAAYAAELGNLLADVFLRSGGRGMALFTSYRMLQAASGTLEERLPPAGIEVLSQGRSGSREAITERFTREVKSVLLGTHSFWEGVDAVGETLSCLVVARLPFAVFTDPVVAARSEAIEAEGRSAFTEYSLPAAVIRFRQGFGRLIRHRNDRGVVIVTDRRILTKGYGGWFARSLPTVLTPCPERAAFLDAVSSFLQPAGN